MSQAAHISLRLNQLLANVGLDPLDAEIADRFADYCDLLLRWNARTNLTAVRDEEGILTRHFVESIACARLLPAGITSLLDFGSGAGFPGVPIALCRPEIAVTLAEAKNKKAAFLREVVRVLEVPIQIHASRAEVLSARFSCVTLRAVDDMSQAVVAAAKLVAEDGWLAVMTTKSAWESISVDLTATFGNQIVQALPGSERRELLLLESIVPSK